VKRPAFFRPNRERDTVISHDGTGALWSLAERVASSQGLELVEVEQGGGKGPQVLRFFIDKPGGVNVADCARLSRELGDRLEAEDTIDTSYVIEVSSPGIERPLRKASDFERFAGHSISVRLRRGSGEAGKLRFSGILRCIEDKIVTVDLGGGEERSFPLGGIAKARLKVNWDSVLRGEAPGGESGNPDHGGTNR